MRVLMLSEFYPPIIGGIGQHVQTLSKELARRGHHVAIATLGHEGCPGWQEDEGMPVYRINGWNTLLTSLYENKTRQFHPTVPDPGVMAQLLHIIRRERPEVIHAHGWILYSLLGLKAFTNAKIVVTLHDNSLICPTRSFVYKNQTCSGPSYSKCISCASGEYGPRFARTKAALLTSGMRLSSSMYGFVDQYITVGSALRLTNQAATAASPRSVIVAPNFVADGVAEGMATARRPDFLPEGDDYILFAGRLSPHKGLGVLLEAYRGLADLAPLVVIIAEELDHPQPFPAEVTVVRNASHDDVMAAWAHCAVAVVPSTSPDSCPTSTIEAMACGKPVVASAIGGMLDQVIDGASGLLVTPGDAHALREALRQLLLDPSKRARMGEVARTHARNFMVSTVAARVEQIYSELVQAPSRGQTGQPVKASHCVTQAASG